MAIILLALAPDSISDSALDRIRELAPDMEILFTKDPARIEPVIGQVEIAAGDFPRELFDRAPALRWLQQWGAGADWLLNHPEIAAMDFELTNASGVHAVPISEHILAFLFAFARDFQHMMRAQVRAEWMRHSRNDVFELAGSTMVLIGVGAIGERTAAMASSLGMRVLGVRRRPDVDVAGVEAMFDLGQLDQLLPQADFVVLTVPLTPETRGLIGERELRSMKSGAYLINIGRGGTVDEDALLRALEGGWIAGAGLDVFRSEPLPPESPFWAMENVIVTAHYSGQTPRYNERASEIFLDNLQRYCAGEPLRNLVDKQLGY